MRHTPRPILAALLVVFASTSQPRAERAPAPWLGALQSIPSPAAAASGMPQITTSADGLVLSWVERSGTRATLRLADRTTTGWSAPRTVSSGDDWFVNWADVPSAIRLADGTLAAHWLQKSAGSTYAYDVKLAFSRDDGRTWSAPTSPHHDGTKTEHGFASLYQVPGGGLGLVWLDGRGMTHADGHEAGDAGNMSLRAATFAPDGTQRDETAVDLRVCECCPTTVAVTSEGPVVAFRDRSDEEIRDIYVSRLVGGTWTEGVAVHADNWQIPACPVNGPALSARDRLVVAAWFTVQDDQGRAYVAFSPDAGRTFGPRIRVDDAESLGRVDVELLDDGAAAVSWVEFADERAQFRVRRVDQAGMRSPAITVSGLAAGRTSGYPRMARRGGELVFAWTETGPGSSQVQTAVATLAK